PRRGVLPQEAGPGRAGGRAAGTAGDRADSEGQPIPSEFGEVIMAQPHLTISVTLENKKALPALRKVVDVLEDLAEDFDYRQDVKEAVKAGKYALKHLVFVVENNEGRRWFYK